MLAAYPFLVSTFELRLSFRRLLRRVNRHQVDKWEDEHPHEVNEVPVKAADLDILVPDAPDSDRDPAEVEHARQDVKHMQPGDCKEGRAEERRRLRLRMATRSLTFNLSGTVFEF